MVELTQEEFERLTNKEKDYDALQAKYNEEVENPAFWARDFYFELPTMN